MSVSKKKDLTASSHYDVVVVGGGAAGFFTAINIAEKRPGLKVIILEKTGKLLSKVKISGGGRCNVTNARSKPSELVQFYPRGSKKLYSVFKRFSTTDMMQWLAHRGVETKAEGDLRIFPISDNSQTIIDCFKDATSRLRIDVVTQSTLLGLSKKEDRWRVETSLHAYESKKVVVACGSSNKVWELLSKMGLSIEPPVPSLFTFKVKDARLEGLQGIGISHAQVKIVGTKLREEGPMLITHWGLSGPAILKLSAIGALELSRLHYDFQILINYVGQSAEEVHQSIRMGQSNHPKKLLHKHPLFDLPKRLWIALLNYAEIKEDIRYSDLSKKAINKITEELTQGLYEVNGKSAFKEEFVTAGGVHLSEIDLDSFEAKAFPGLFLAGEILNIDALTGGFNFQACWSAGWVISEALKRTD